MLGALERCQRYRVHLDSHDATVSEMALDAALRNLAVAGEAAKSLSEHTRAQLESVPWHSIAGLRNVVVHEYFRIETAVIVDILDSEVTSLVAAIRGHLETDDGD